MSSRRLQEATGEERRLEVRREEIVKIILRSKEPMPAGYVWRYEEVAQAGKKYLWVSLVMKDRVTFKG